MSETTSQEIKARFERFGVDREAFDSMPETPDMGYHYKSIALHGSRYRWYVELVRTYSKIQSAYYLSDPKQRKLTVKLSGHRFELGFSKRRFWFQREFQAEDGTPYLMGSLPPERWGAEMDQRREAQRRWLDARKPRAVVPGSTDLEHHKEHGYFEDYGYAWVSYEPNDDQAERVLVLILRPLTEKGISNEVVIAMDHNNRFGLDVDDARSLNEVTDKLVSEILNPQHEHELLLDPGTLREG